MRLARAKVGLKFPIADEACVDGLVIRVGGNGDDFDFERKNVSAEAGARSGGAHGGAEMAGRFADLGEVKPGSIETNGVIFPIDSLVFVSLIDIWTVVRVPEAAEEDAP